MADREKKEGKTNIKIEISQERKEFFRWNKKHFSWLFKGIHSLEKWKIGDTSFK